VTFRLLLALFLLPALAVAADSFVPDIAANVTRPWPGKDFWSNPAEDWSVSKGRLENSFSGGNRNIVLLTAELSPAREPFNLRVHLDQVSFELFGTGFVGFQVGLRGVDHRAAALDGCGFPVGIDFSGTPFIGGHKADGAALPLPLLSMVLELKGEPAGGDQFRLSLLVQDATGKILRTVATTVHASWLEGLVSLTASTQPAPTVDLAAPRPAHLDPIARTREGEGRFAFSQLALSGAKFTRHPERAFGPILWTTHSFDNDGTLCLLAQAAPFGRAEKLEAELHLPGREPQFAYLDPVSRSARFRVMRLDPTREIPYEVKLAGDSFKGSIRGAATGRPLKIASLSGSGGTATGLPDAELVANVSAQNPDLISFHGGQIDDQNGGYGQIYDHRPGDRAIICYLRKYALHGWAWRELLRSTPSLTLPGDHDVFHRKLWGANGARSDISRGYGPQAEDSGGYKMSVEFVNAVHRTQTGNLPDPADPAPCASGISVYFTRHAWGPLDFLILADHQFKSAPKPLLPAAGIEAGWPRASDWNPAGLAAAVDDASLLGIRQEAFIDRWAKSPAKGAKFRVALSQHPFVALRSLPGGIDSDDGQVSPKSTDDEPKPDFVANAWPPAPRTKALELLTAARAVHLCGGPFPASSGRYLGSAGKPGLWWTSAAPATASPAIRWAPAGKPSEAANDAFGHPFQLRALANSAGGYLISTWDPASGQVRLENWPANSSPAQPAPDNQPFPGWPLGINPAE